MFREFVEAVIPGEGEASALSQPADGRMFGLLEGLPWSLMRIRTQRRSGSCEGLTRHLDSWRVVTNYGDVGSAEENRLECGYR